MSEGTVFNKIQQTLDSIKDSLLLTDSKLGQFLVYKHDNTISKSIDLFGEYCHKEIDIIKSYLEDQDPAMAVYVDIGTNIGYHAVGVFKAVGCNVVGMEPNPKHFALASYNARDYNKIQIVNAGASDKETELIMKDFDPSTEGNYGDVHKIDKDGITVRAVPLDSLNLNRASFIKYDVEGHEFEALKGSTKTISKFRPVIMYEAMEWDVWNSCYEFLDDRKYIQYWVACRTKPLHETFKPTEENPFGPSTVANILAVPSEQPQPDYLVEVVPGEPFNDCFKRYKKLQLLF